MAPDISCAFKIGGVQPGQSEKCQHLKMSARCWGYFNNILKGIIGCLWHIEHVSLWKNT